MNDNRFARLFEIGENGCQLMVYREWDDENDFTVIHHVTVFNWQRADFQFEIRGENQEETAANYLKNIDQEEAESLYLKLIQLVRG